MSSVPPPASAMRKPCLEGFYEQNNKMHTEKEPNN